MTVWLLEILLSVIPTVLAITLHEAAHGYAAWALGDDTAKQAGRLSLNPLRHVDRMGTIILPGLLILGQLLTLGRVQFLFGWAKPVPVSAWRFRDPRRGMAIVAAAGPAMNFALAWLGALSYHVFNLVPDSIAAPAAEMVDLFILVNLVLGLFNLIPVPPLDGGRIVVGLLPPNAARAWARLERVGLALVLIMVLVLPQLGPSLGIHFDPVHDLLNDVLPGAQRFVYRLAFIHV
jgi:Zn-dependent protease